MLIAQLSDLHIGFGGDSPDEANARRLRSAIECVLALDPRPDLVLLTGDLTERGDIPSYRRLRQMIAALPMRVELLVGNHDSRDALCAVFPEVTLDHGFLQKVVDFPDRRFILLDTLEEGRAGGAFDEPRAGWLRARLADAPTTPTFIALHHPPFAVGIDWMDPVPDTPWIARLADAIVDAPHVVAMVAGHLHRPIASRFGDRPFVVASSVAPQIALDFRHTDLSVPDGRALIVDEPPSFVLHYWIGTSVVSHFMRVEQRTTLARLDLGTWPQIDELRREGPGN